MVIHAVFLVQKEDRVTAQDNVLPATTQNSNESKGELDDAKMTLSDADKIRVEMMIKNGGIHIKNSSIKFTFRMRM